MPVSIKGTGGGSVTLSAAAAATDTTLTIPNVTGTVLQSGTAVTAAQGGTGVTSTGAAGNVLFTTDGSTWSATQKIVAGTAVASTSGTSIDFTSIPSWVKRVTVMLSGVSTNSTSSLLVQVGAGSVTSSGYVNSVTGIAFGTSGGATASTAGVPIFINSAGNSISGCVSFFLLGSNKWVASGVFGTNGTPIIGITSAGEISLSGALDRVRITTVNGTDTFDAGSINILYE